MIDSDNIVLEFMFFIVDFFCRYSKYVWCFGFQGSAKVSYFEIFIFCVIDFRISEIVLDHTSGNSDFLVWSYHFEFSCDFVFSFLLDRTGMKNNNISFAKIFCIRKSTISQYCLYSCAVSIIHLATKDYNMKLHIVLYFRYKYIFLLGFLCSYFIWVINKKKQLMENHILSCFFCKKGYGMFLKQNSSNKKKKK